MFIDASACVAIIAKEPEAESLLSKMNDNGHRFITSPLALWESTVVVARLGQRDLAEAKDLVDRFHKELNAVKANITPEMGVVALKAFEKYGKGTGHKAQLNMGDCFTYAVAKSYRVPILYIGDNFLHTDMG